MDKKLESRIARLERMMNHKSFKNEDISSGRFIDKWDLVAILMSLAGVSNASSLLNNEKEILERIVEKYKDDDEISLDTTIVAPNFVAGGTLSKLLSSIFDRTEGVLGNAEKAVRLHTSMKRKYDL